MSEKEIQFRAKTFKGIDCDVLEQYENIKENLLSRNPTWTEGRLFEELVNHYARPIKMKEELTQQLEQLKKEAEELRTQNASLAEQLSEAQQTANTNAEQANAQQLQYEQQLQTMKEEAEAKALKETQRVVSFVPDCLKAVEAVAARESKRRGQQWTVSHVINFFIHSRFINGSLNGDLQSLSDGECRKLGIALNKKPAKMEVEI